MAGNAAIGSKKTHQTDEWVSTGLFSGYYKMSTGDCKYGFELFYLNQGNNNVDLATATTWLKNRNWDTNLSGSISNIYYPASWGTATYHSSIGDYGYYERNTDNASEDAPHRDQHRSYTVYFAAMAYLWNDEQYPGDVSIGFKGIPEYTYYTTVTYYLNDGTTNTLRNPKEYTTTDKTEKVMLFKNPTTAEKNMLKRTGYTFLGWSTDPNATTPEYEFQDDFLIYDDVNGGGRGPVSLYAVWKGNNYIVTLHKNDGDNQDETVKVTVTYGEPMPENIGLVAPAKVGYDFRGYSSTSSGNAYFYYDAELKSVRVYDKAEDSDLYARWTPHTTTIHFDFDGGSYNPDNVTVTATYNQPMPTNGVPVPTRPGYTFAGYNYPANNKTYYNYGKDENDQWVITSATTWRVDVGEATLKAIWIPIEYIVTLDHNGGAGENEEVVVFYNQQMPSVDSNGETLKAPTRDGYMFLGYTTETNGGDTYYSLDWQGNLVSYRQWPKAENGTLYAQWEKIYKITLDADGGTFDGSVSTWPETSILEKNEGSLVLQVRTNQAECAQVYCSNRINIKPGYKLLGWYTKPQNEGDADQHPALHNDGTLVYSITPGNNFSYHFYAVPNTVNAWDGDGKWIGTSDLTLYAHYEIIFEVENDVVTFLDMDPKNCVSAEDLTAALNYAKNHGTKLINTLDMKYPDTGADQLEGEGIMKVFEDAKAEANSIVSPNALILFTNTYPKVRNTNAVTITADKVQCQNLVVADRYSMRIPLEFEADKALYERNKLQIGTDDKMWEQSHESLWGTLCLPYPIKNNNTFNDGTYSCKVIFYELRKKSGNVMQFYKLPEDAVIDANTPVLYERTDGVGSNVTIEEVISSGRFEKIVVPENIDYSAATKTYSRAVLNTEYDWQFIGNMKETIFYGKNYTKVSKDLRETKDNVYYIKKDNFTRLSDTNYMTLYPYRAYFREVDGANSDAKLASFSILVIDEEGATDITNAILGEGEGDGKIYDLNGVRVKQPVKGRLYIVNGKKKVYE